MTDSKTTIEDLKKVVAKFVTDRDWQKYHSPKDLSMAIAVEAAELMELFQWMDTQTSIAEVERKRTQVEEELADILFSLLNFAELYKIDLSSALQRKVKINELNYSIAETKGDYLLYEAAKKKRKNS